MHLIFFSNQNDTAYWRSLTTTPFFLTNKSFIYITSHLSAEAFGQINMIIF